MRFRLHTFYFRLGFAEIRVMAVGRKKFTNVTIKRDIASRYTQYAQ